MCVFAHKTCSNHNNQEYFQHVDDVIWCFVDARWLQHRMKKHEPKEIFFIFHLWLCVCKCVCVSVSSSITEQVNMTEQNDLTILLDTTSTGIHGEL